jgi:hypothetical protein
MYFRPTFTPSFTDPISARIPLKIKEKIWAGEYIDLYVLLKSVRELATDSQLSGDLSIKGGQLTVTQPKIAEKGSLLLSNFWLTFLLSKCAYLAGVET